MPAGFSRQFTKVIPAAATKPTNEPTMPPNNHDLILIDSVRPIANPGILRAVLLTPEQGSSCQLGDYQMIKLITR